MHNAPIANSTRVAPPSRHLDIARRTRNLLDEDDQKDGSEDALLLPPLKVGETVAVTEYTANGHATTPPPRYTEASIVKKLEELGIGRPSTWVIDHFNDGRPRSLRVEERNIARSHMDRLFRHQVDGEPLHRTHRLRLHRWC